MAMLKEALDILFGQIYSLSIQKLGFLSNQTECKMVYPVCRTGVSTRRTATGTQMTPATTGKRRGRPRTTACTFLSNQNECKMVYPLCRTGVSTRRTAMATQMTTSTMGKMKERSIRTFFLERFAVFRL